jgi:hypothetical protein
MRILPSQNSSSRTEFQQIRWVPDRKQDRTSHNYSEKISSCQICLKNLSSENLQFLYDQKVWNLWLQLYHQRILEKEPNDELRQNFIHDEMQLHTSTHSELNLIKSVIYFMFEFYFIFYILNTIYYNFITNDELNNIDLIFVIYNIN